MIFKQVILSRLLDCHLLHPNSDQTSLQVDILEHRQCISSNIFLGIVLFVHFKSDFKTLNENFNDDFENIVTDLYSV